MFSMKSREILLRFFLKNNTSSKKCLRHKKKFMIMQGNIFKKKWEKEIIGKFRIRWKVQKKPKCFRLSRCRHRFDRLIGKKIRLHFIRMKQVRTKS